MFTKIALSAAVAVSALTALPAAAEAQSRYGYSDRYDNGSYNQRQRYDRNDRRYQNRNYQNQRYDSQRYGNYYGQRCRSNGSTGTILGAIAGGLLGREVAGRGDRTVGTIIGGAAGALAGRAIDRDGNCRR
jgi:outer membrane lipoprotein SlyB